MKYLLDTNVCIRFINGRAPMIRQHMLSIVETDIAISTITMGEMYSGSAKSQYPQRSRAKQDAFFSRFTHLSFDVSSADEFGKIRAYLEKAGTPIGAYDMQIASIALVHNLTVVTHNTGEFSRVPNLKLEDWES